MTTDSNHTADEEYEDDKVVETSPDGRFVRVRLPSYLSLLSLYIELMKDYFSLSTY